MNAAPLPANRSNDPARSFHARAANDLFSHLRGAAPRRIALLRQDAASDRTLIETRFPRAPVESLDLAQLDEPASSDEPFDLIHSLGDLEWRPSLRRRLPRLIERLRLGGWLAALLPNDLYEPYRAVARMVAAEGPWAATLLPVAKTRPFNPTLEGLYATLTPLCVTVDVWETTYLCALPNVEAIVDFAREGALAPFLARLDADARQPFLDHYREQVDAAYPPQADGAILVRLPRIFVLAER